LNAIQKRTPAKEDRYLVFVGVAFAVHIWAYINVLDAVPAWVLRMSAFELIGVVSYVLAFALMESLVVWGGLVLLAVILPAALLRRHFLAQATSLMLVAAGWSVALHYNYGEFVMNRQYALLWAGAFLVTMLAAYLAAGRIQKIDTSFRWLLSKIDILTFLYLSLDVIAVVVIIIRNIF